MAEIVGLTVNSKTKQLQLIGALGVGKLQEKTVEANEKEQVISPDYGYYGLKSVTVEALEILPKAEYEYFGGGNVSEEYTIRGETLDNIANSIQAKKETTAIFTPDQMAKEIESIVVGDELPNAEEVSFGTSVVNEHSITETGTISTNSNRSDRSNRAHKFLVNETIGFVGFRCRFESAGGWPYVLQLWDVESDTKITEVSYTPSATATWYDIPLETPINLLAGKEYVIVQQAPVFKAYWASRPNMTFNAKITDLGTDYNDTADSPPSAFSGFSTGKYYWGMVMFIIGKAVTESDTTEYKIQKDTMNGIADEVARITGTAGTLTPAQIITALKSVAVQSS